MKAALLILIFGFLVEVFLAALIFLRNRKNPVNMTYSLIVLLSAFWTLAIFFMWLSKTSSVALIWAKLSFVGPILILPALLYFSKVFPSVVKAKTLDRSIIIASFMAFGLLVLTYLNRIISEVEIYGEVVIPKTGDLFLAFPLYFSVGATIAYYFLFRKYKSEKGIAKSQIRYLFLGTGLTAVTGLLLNIILPLLKYDQYTFLGPLSVFFMVSFTSYAIVKHRLMDIRLIIVRSISFSLLLFVLISGFALPLYKLMFWAAENGVGTTGQIAIGVTAAIIIGILIPYVRKGLTKATDAIFFKQEYSPEKFQKEVGNILSSNIILSELLHKTLDHIIKEFRLFEGMFVVTEGDKVYTVQSIGYKKAPKVAFKDVKSLCRFPIVVYDELEEGSRAKNILRKYEVSIVVPLIEEHQFAGVLLLGDKKSGDMFSSKDISTLEIVAPEIAMAMQRAKQYGEIQRFNVTLKAEVLRATRKLTEANEHLKELDKAKDEFISMASHQLRTPLTAIKGYLSMLLEGDAGEIKIGQYDFIDEAFQGANKMVALINDLLNVSRMSTGKFFIDPKELDMKVMIDDEIKQLAVTARQKGLYLKFEHPKVMPIVEADENKIRQVIMNFIDNALFYTEKGGVTVKAMYNKHDFVFEVHDTGIGVPREVQGKLFAKFYRADNARKLRPDGNGLGLYLAKRVVEDHGGEIIFRSSPKGSVFGFRIPIRSKIKAGQDKKRLIVA